MTTHKFTQPDRTTKAATLSGAQAWMQEIDDATAVVSGSALGQFSPYASTPPDMKVWVGAGRVAHSLGIKAGVSGGSETTALVSVAAAATATISAPSGNPRIDRVGINAVTGAVVLLTGSESATPSAPAYPDGVIPVCSVSLSVGQAAITNAHLTDERGMVVTESAAASSGGISTLFGDVVGYEIYNVAGSYSFMKPPRANFYRLTIVGAGGGGGGAWGTPQQICTSVGTGGGGGGGASLTGIVVAAENLSITIGAGGYGNFGANMPTNDAGIGYAGGNTTVSGVTSGFSLVANGGTGGGRGTTGPTAGTGGAGGTASTGGVAGAAGGNGATGAPGSAGGGSGGKCGDGSSMFIFPPADTTYYDTTYSATQNGVGGRGGACYDTTWARGCSYLAGAGQNGGDGFVLIEWF